MIWVKCLGFDKGVSCMQLACPMKAGPAPEGVWSITELIAFRAGGPTGGHFGFCFLYMFHQVNLSALVVSENCYPPAPGHLHQWQALCDLLIIFRSTSFFFSLPPPSTLFSTCEMSYLFFFICRLILNINQSPESDWREMSRSLWSRGARLWSGGCLQPRGWGWADHPRWVLSQTAAASGVSQDQLWR